MPERVENMADGSVVITFTAAEMMRMFGIFRTEPKNPDHTLDSDSQLIAIAQFCGATHLMFPAWSDGWMFKFESGCFKPVASYGTYSDGRYWVNQYWGAINYPLDTRDKLMELPQVTE
jgi:hypothetical protein